MRPQDRVILLVEDDPSDEKLMLRAFLKNGIGNTVVVARDGQEALDWIFATGPYEGRQGGLPQVILLDLQLPKIGGLDVLRRIRADETTRLLPVVILTSSREDGDRLRGYSLGTNSYVRKPVDFVEFVEAVRQLGMYWLIVNEPPPMSR